MQDAICEENFPKESYCNRKLDNQPQLKGVGGLRFAIALAGLVAIFAITAYETFRYLLN